MFLGVIFGVFQVCVGIYICGKKSLIMENSCGQSEDSVIGEIDWVKDRSIQWEHLLKIINEDIYMFMLT